jgi:signal transduction histidine kinase
MESHQGEVKVESEVEKGTTVTLFLPGMRHGNTTTIPVV